MRKSRKMRTKWNARGQGRGKNEEKGTRGKRFSKRMGAVAQISLREGLRGKRDKKKKGKGGGQGERREATRMDRQRCRVSKAVREQTHSLQQNT